MKNRKAQGASDRRKSFKPKSVKKTNEGGEQKRAPRSAKAPYKKKYDKPAFRKEKKAPPKDQKETKITEAIRLNKYIANAGICSRREADKLIAAGLVSVNGKIIVEMGYKINPGDQVKYNGERLSTEKKIYVIMNKPKDTVTTVDDPDGRRTVMDLLDNKIQERIYPIGRLDRNTTGVLLLTNDGELSQRLMHPKYQIQKVYHAVLNKKLKGEDFWELTNGVELEDGFMKPDALAYPDSSKKEEVGIEIHSGRNRIVHRMFEHMGYLLDKLDRVSYAGFVKKGLKRGEWRELTEKEVNQLKRMVRLG
jgi:23S rRNA pseudouridine2605 synthase